MKKIRKYNELFDTEDIKSHFEIPYLQGNIEKILSDFKNLGIENDEPFDSYMKKILYRYQVISKFNLTIHDSTPVFYATSKTPKEGVEWYGQIAFGIHKNKYIVVVIFKDLESDDESEWLVREYTYDKPEDVYPMVDAFIRHCKHLNIVEDSDTLDPKEN